MNNMSTIELSFIIVNWNAKDFLKACLSSIKKTIGNINHEIIVVDNGSEDGAPDMVSAEFPDVILIRNNDNVGFGRANNIGIKRSRGEYLCLVNSDVEILEGCVSRLINYMKENERIGLTGPKIFGKDGNIQRSCMGFPTLWNMFCCALGFDKIFNRSSFFSGYMLHYWNHNDIKDVDIINGCFWIIKRTALNEVGVFDERFFMYGEDMDFCRRFHEKGWRVVFYSKAEAIHYGGGSSSLAPYKYYIAMQKANYQYWNKYNKTSSTIAYSLIKVLHEAVRIAGNSVLYVFNPKQREASAHKIRRSAMSLHWYTLKSRLDL